MKKETIIESAILFCFLAMPLGLVILALSACEQPKERPYPCYKRDKPQCWSEADWKAVCNRIQCKPQTPSK